MYDENDKQRYTKSNHLLFAICYLLFESSGLFQIGNTMNELIGRYRFNGVN